MWRCIAVRSLVARLDPAQKLRDLVDTAVTGSIRTFAALFTLGLPVAAALMSLPFWFYWQGIPTPDQSLIPQIPASVGSARRSCSAGWCTAPRMRSAPSSSAGLRIWCWP